MSRKDGWPRFDDFEQSAAGYLRYLAAWIGQRATVEETSEIPAEVLVDHWLADSLAARCSWPEATELEDYVDDPDEISEEGWTQFHVRAECVFTLFWDSGGPGAGAGEERIFRWQGKFYFFSEYWDVPNPFDSFEEALKGSEQCRVSTATQWIRSKLMGSDELVKLLEPTGGGIALSINGEDWRFDEGSSSWKRGQQ